MARALPPPRTLPSALRAENHGSADFGHAGLFAYGCGTAVVVVEPHSAQVLQTLEDHTGPVTRVRWALEGPLQVAGEPSACARLASGDAAGAIVVWDALAGRSLHRFQDSALVRCPIVDLAWHAEDASLLLSLHAPGAVTLWSVRGRCRVARHEAGERLTAAVFSPFDPGQLCLASARGSIAFLSFDPAAAAAASGPSSAARQGFEVGPKYQVSTPVGPAGDSSDLQAIAYVPFVRDLLFFVLSREIAVFDVALGLVVCSTPLERKCSPLSYVLPCRYREDLLFSVHRDGSLGVWTARGGEVGSTGALTYDLLHTGELVKQYRRGGAALAGACVCPLSESTLASITSDGRVWIWDMDLAAALRRPQRGSPLSLSALVEAIPAKVTAIEALPGGGPLALGLANGELLVLEPGTLAIGRRFSVAKEAIRGVAWVDPVTLVAFSHEELQRATGGERERGGPQAAAGQPPKRMYRNACALIDLRTGHCGELRTEAMAGAAMQAGISRGRGAGGGEEASPIALARPSPSGGHLAVLPRDRPLELWDLRGPRLARAFGHHAGATALAWLAPDRFAFAAADGALRQFRLDESSVAYGAEGPLEPDLAFAAGPRGPAPVTALAASPEWLVAGDAAGALRRCHLPTGRAGRLGADPPLPAGPADEPAAAVRRVAIAPACPGVRAAALAVLASGEASLYDLESGQQVAGCRLRALDGDWAAPGRPLLAGADGAARLFDATLAAAALNAPAASRAFPDPPRGPHLLPPHAALCVRALLQHAVHPSVAFPSGGVPPAGGYPAGSWLVEPAAAEHYKSLGPDLFALLGRCEGTPARCALAASYFGDADECRFWAVAAHALRRPAPRPPSPLRAPTPRAPPPVPPRSPTRGLPPTPAPLPRFGLHPSFEETGTRLKRAPDSLPSFLDLSRDGPSVLESGRRRVEWYAGRPLQPEERSKLTHHAISIGRLAEGVDLLQQTPAEDPQYFVSALKACVVAASVGREAFEDAVKLAAVTMMARGGPKDVDEGVQLLCSVGRAADAVRYLAQANRWVEALAIARSSLPPLEAAPFVSTYAELMLRFQRRARALEALLSIGSFSRVLDVLVDANLVERAALFAASCAESGVLLDSRRGNSFLRDLAMDDYAALLARAGVKAGAERYRRSSG